MTVKLIESQTAPAAQTPAKSIETPENRKIDGLDSAATASPQGVTQAAGPALIPPGARAVRAPVQAGAASLPKVRETRIANFPAIEIDAVGPQRGKVLFVHGSFGDHTAFAPMMQTFSAAGYAAVAVARRGRAGIGPESLDAVTMDDYLNDLRATIAAIPDRVIVVGHSLGGLLAQHMSVEGRCDAAILLASAPPGMLMPTLGGLARLVPVFPRVLRGVAFRPADDVIATLALRGMSPDEQKRVLATLGSESGKVFRSMVFGTGGPAKSAPQCPVLVAAGTNDWIIPAATVRNTATAYGADVVTFDGKGHWLIEQQGHEEVSESIITWLKAKLSVEATAAES